MKTRLKILLLIFLSVISLKAENYDDMYQNIYEDTNPYVNYNYIHVNDTVNDYLSSTMNFITFHKFNINYETLLNQQYENAINKLNDKVTGIIKDDNKQRKIYIQIGKQLDKILNKNMSETEKSETVYKDILHNLSKESIVDVNSRNLKLQHSLDYGATVLSIDNITKNESFNTKKWQIIRECDFYGECYTTGYYRHTKNYLTQIPEYKIYRVVNNKDYLITTISHSNSVKSSSIGFTYGDSAKDFIKNNYSSIYDIIKNNDKYIIPKNKVFITDFNSQLRNNNTTLSYKVVVRYVQFRKGNVTKGSSQSITYNIDADENADGRIDFIHKEDYDKIESKYFVENGGLIPIISLLLN